MSNAVEKSEKSQLALDSGVQSIKFLTKKKRAQGKQLTPVEKHLAHNIDNIRNGIFAPSFAETVLSITHTLLIPMLMLGIVIGLFYLQGSISEYVSGEGSALINTF